MLNSQFLQFSVIVEFLFKYYGKPFQTNFRQIFLLFKKKKKMVRDINYLFKNSEFSKCSRNLLLYEVL